MGLMRLSLPDINIASSTAYMTLGGMLGVEECRANSLRLGCNVIMPNVTPVEKKINYTLYEQKQFLDVDQSYVSYLDVVASSVGKRVCLYNSGNSAHYLARTNINTEYNKRTLRLHL